MISSTTRAAGGVARSLVAAVVGAVGTIIGAVVGFLTGFVMEDGLLQGALVGAVTGALVSVELADSLLRIWTCDDCSMDTRIKRTRVVLQSFAAGRLLRGCVFQVVSSALDAQLEGLRQNYSGDEGRVVTSPSASGTGSGSVTADAVHATATGTEVLA